MSKVQDRICDVILRHTSRHGKAPTAICVSPEEYDELLTEFATLRVLDGEQLKFNGTAIYAVKDSVVLTFREYASEMVKKTIKERKKHERSSERICRDANPDDYHLNITRDANRKSRDPGKGS